MLLHIAIFEDEPIFVEQLKEIIKKWSIQKKTEVICDWYRDGDQLTSELLENCDLLFFDIEMNGRISGIETAKRARASNEAIPLVFTTMHKNYVLEGYDVEAYKFLIKPVQEKDCFACMERAKRYHDYKETDVITLPQGKGIRCIPVCDIFYIESQQHYCNVITRQENFRFYVNLSSIVEKLPKGKLIQCHRSYIVNYAHIVRMESGFLTLRSLGKIPYSRTFAKQLLQKLSGMEL